MSIPAIAIETARVHHAARRCGGLLAAWGTRAAVRPDAAGRRAYGHLRKRSPPESLGFGVHAGARRPWLEGRREHPYRKALGRGRTRALTNSSSGTRSHRTRRPLRAGTPPTTALRQMAPTTPLVFVMISDPVSSGLVSSLAHPGGNITGFTNYKSSMGGKWLELLKEIAPSTARVAAIFNPDNPALPGQLRSVEAAGPNLGIQVTAKPARNAEEFERTISAGCRWAKRGSPGVAGFCDIGAS